MHQIIIRTYCTDNKSDYMNSNKLITGSMDNTINDSIVGYITTTDYETHLLKIVIDNQSFLVNTTLDTEYERNKQSFKFYVPIKYEDGVLHNVELYDDATNQLLDKKQFMFHYLEHDPNEYKLLKQYEMDYKNNVYRSFKQRLESIFYPISLLLHRKKFGTFKNTLKTIKACHIIKKESLFDVGYYINNNPALLKDGTDLLLHYIYEGEKLGYKPHKNFDGNRYLSLNPDVKRENYNPLVHYALYGRSEKRNLNFDLDMDSIPESIKDDVELIHESGLFNEAFYLDKYEDVLNSNLHPIEHYVRFGYKEKRNPSTSFNTDFYVNEYDDFNMYTINPLIHYIQEGQKDNRPTTGSKGNIQLEDDLITGWFSTNTNKEVNGKLVIDRQEFSIEDSISIDEKSNTENDSDSFYRFEFVIPENFLDGKRHFVKLLDSNKIIMDSFVKSFYNITSTDVHVKRTVSKEQMNELSSIIEDIDLDSIPSFGEDAPLVSIIVVNRDGLNHLKRLFNGMGAVSNYYPNFEVIVVDNASADDSVEFVKSWNEFKVTCVENSVNESFSHANNQALEVANGKYLLFLNNDIEPLSGFLNFMMESLLSNDNVGAVGARLFYPDCSSSTINADKSFSVQHNGIMFKESEGFIRPFNRENGVEVYDSTGDVFSVAGVTAACLLVSRDDFESVGGFDEAFVYGYEDVDFCLKLVRDGLDILCDGRARLYHYEFGTQQLDSGREVRDRRLNNRRVFVDRWNTWLRRQLFLDKLNGNTIYSNQKLCVALVVTECGEGATAGDYFTALGLAGKFEQFGWTVKFLPQRGSQRSWYYVDDDVDVLISLLDRYDLRKVRCANSSLIKVAWLRNWFERWVSMPYFMMYDMVLCSSRLACDFVSEYTGKNSYLFPLATDTSMFNGDVTVVDDFTCDYCFTGSYWDADREIVDCLNPDVGDYTFKLYGANWEKVSSLSKYSSGFVSYGDLPGVYASCRIVLDDANHVTRGFGSVNSRVFDAISCGRLVFTNGSKGNDEVFDGKLPEYQSQDQLIKLLGYYLENEDAYDKKVRELQEIVLNNHTYTHRADRLKEILTEYVNKKKITIKIPAPSWDEVHKWGDFYLAEGLMKEFVKKDMGVQLQVLPEWDGYTDSNSDIVLVLRGLSEYKPKMHHQNIMWNISHPDLVSLEEYSKYDHVFIASKKWTDELSKKVDVPVECMWQCTDTNRFYPDYNEDYKHELLFVGNSRKVYRKILNDLLPTEHELAVYGSDWEDLIDEKYIKGDFVSNKDLRKLYSSCNVLLNDHWEDMREKGFVSNRIFDAVACGSCVITDDIDGLEELFSDEVHSYKSKEELKELVNDCLKEKTVFNQEIIKKHTYESRVNQIMAVLNSDDD